LSRPLFRFSHRTSDPFAFGGERLLVLRLNNAFEAGDPAFQLWQ
jgi:hypothetical protein